ncbi:MAG TPA: peptidylprolyl isomerase, partial [Candidatus Binataceae bacterium]|nr:peptidylprolyl isomerase [Candidatus Binataceae bacterium]
MSNHLTRNLVFASTLILAAIVSVVVAEAGAERPVAQIVATVDGEPVTMHDVQDFAKTAGHPVDGDSTDSGNFKAALKALLTQMMMEQELKKYDDKIDEAQVDRYIAELEQEKGINDQQLRESLMQNNISYDDFRKQQRQTLEKQMMFSEQVRDKVVVTPEEYQAYYDAHKDEFTVTQERYKLAQILIVVPKTATADQVAAAKAKAEDVRKRALAGENFGNLAAQYSDDMSKSQNGELGEFSPDEISNRILAAIKNLKPGQISEVIRTKHGFHIMRVDAHVVPGLRPLADVKEQIRGEI